MDVEVDGRVAEDERDGEVGEERRSGIGVDRACDWTVVPAVD